MSSRLLVGCVRIWHVLHMRSFVWDVDLVCGLVKHAWQKSCLHTLQTFFSFDTNRNDQKKINTYNFKSIVWPKKPHRQVPCVWIWKNLTNILHIVRPNWTPHLSTFDLACFYSRNKIPKEKYRSVSQSTKQSSKYFSRRKKPNKHTHTSGLISTTELNLKAIKHSSYCCSFT